MVNVPKPTARCDRTDLWGITCYFNPARYSRRRANYRLFRERLPIPLIAVELAYGPAFELGDDDAEILVRLRGTAVLWQKERLLNVALRALPPGCRKVAWLDCDIIFEAEDWARRTGELLDSFALVQPFSHLHRMPRDWKPGQRRPHGTELRHSGSFLVASGLPLSACLRTTSEAIACTHGYAWAANRELLDRNALYDACIVGGGDAAMVRAAYGHFDDAIRRQHMNGRRIDHYLAWAEAFHAAVRGNVAFVPGHVLHLWHGRTEHRGWRDRFTRLARFAFDPFTDVAIEPDGAWRWNSDKPELHEFLREYFTSRREDG